MPMPSTTTHKREQIRLDAKRQRDAESSRHEISKLAHELLLKCLDNRRAANERTNLEERARVDDEHSINAAELAVEHENEEKESEDARFAMIVEFDAQRDKLGASLAAKLNEEGLEHTALLESLRTKLDREDQEADQALKEAVDAYNRVPKPTCNCCKYTGPDIAETRTKAQQSAAERHDAYEKLVDRHNAEWKLRQEALRLEFDNRASREARLDLEYQFQGRFAEHDRRQKVIQKRQAEELEILENRRGLAMAVVQQARERAENQLHEEHQRVDEWWQHLCDEAGMAQQRIDEDERHALDKIDRQVAAAALRAEGEAPPVEVEGAATMVDPLEESEEHMTLRESDEDEEKVTMMHHATGEDEIDPGSSETPRPLVGTASISDEPTGTLDTGGSCEAPSSSSIFLADAGPATPVRVQTVDPPQNTPTPFMALGSQYNLVVERVTPVENAPEITSTHSSSHVEPLGPVPDRSGSPDSGGSDSDFVEI